MALVMVNERSEREERQMDCPEGQGTEREKESGGGAEEERGSEVGGAEKERRKKCQLTLTYFALPRFVRLSAPPIGSMSDPQWTALT